MNKAITVVFLVLTLSIVFPSASLAIMIGFDPSNQIINTEDQIFVDVVISDLGDEVVSAFDLDVNYDSNILNATNVNFGTELYGDWFFTLQEYDISTPGLVDFRELSLSTDEGLAAVQPNSFTLATLSFDVISLGTSDLTFTFNGLNDVKGLNNRILDLDVATGSVAPVPEPATLLLLGTGLVGMAGASRKRNKK